VLRFIAEAESTKDVAALLGVSVKTAESHRLRLMQKLDVHETASLVRYAVRRALVQSYLIGGAATQYPVTPRAITLHHLQESPNCLSNQ
jgi:hypothetical protein